jgi:hypothetical protein
MAMAVATGIVALLAMFAAKVLTIEGQRTQGYSIVMA